MSNTTCLYCETCESTTKRGKTKLMQDTNTKEHYMLFDGCLKCYRWALKNRPFQYFHFAGAVEYVKGEIRRVNGQLVSGGEYVQ